MATLIRFKRKKNGADNANIKLQRGEPYYNLGAKKFYIGNDDGGADLSKEIPADQKHIAEITDKHPVTASSAKNAGDATVSFTVGEASDNQYTKTINNVAITKGIILDEIYFGKASKRNNLASAMGVEEVPKGTVFFQEAE